MSIIVCPFLTFKIYTSVLFFWKANVDLAITLVLILFECKLLLYPLRNFARMGWISTSNRNNTMIVPTVHWKIFKPF
jgi:hypothetical protein